MKNLSKYTKRHIVVLAVLLSSVGVMAAANEYLRTTQVLSDHIFAKASQLKAASHDPVRNSHEIEGILTELKGLIGEYEENILFAQSPYPGEILMGRTPAGHSTWLETLCDGRYEEMLKEIRIRRVGRWPSYIRINDIEITYSTPRGLMKEIFNENGRAKLYRGGVFKLALPRPMRISRIRINIGHASSGLEVYGIPYKKRTGRHILPNGSHILPNVGHPAEKPPCPAKMLLGTTPPGHSNWLETLCSRHCGGLIREIRLKRTGQLTQYLRINDIEITYMTPRGPKKEVFNKGGRVKLYYGGEFKLALPRLMRVTRIRINIGHESTGLEVYGIH